MPNAALAASAPAMPTLNQDMARALTDAGYMPVSEYLRLCEENGWKAAKD